MYPEDLKYTREHEWIRVNGAEGTVGITHYAQEHLGDVVFVELPEVGRVLSQGEAFGVVESVKTVSDLYAPAGGKVIRVNERLLDQPDLVNGDPHGEGWMIVIEIATPGELDSLLDAAGYQNMLSEAGE